jgi:hypothetical protein
MIVLDMYLSWIGLALELPDGFNNYASYKASGTTQLLLGGKGNNGRSGSSGRSDLYGSSRSGSRCSIDHWVLDIGRRLG